MGLVLAPFRAVRFDPDSVRDIAAVTCPPYDVIEPGVLDRLEASEAHNVVRLTLPRGDGPSRYANAASTLRSWLDEQVLIVDDSPALYLYEQRWEFQGTDHRQRGLIGALALRSPEDNVVLPHEDVMPNVVLDRLQLMRTTQANIEPIFLTYESAPATGSLLDSIVVDTALMEATTDDGFTHRLWRVSNPTVLAQIAEDLAPRQALIADGHHRYAAYRELQSEHRQTDPEPGPVDFGLALLVDLNDSPPTLGAIHRTVEGLALDDAVQLALPTFRFEQLPTAQTLEQIADELARRDIETPTLALVAPSGRAGILTLEDVAAASQLIPSDKPEVWRNLDVTVLHHVLLDSCWSAGEAAVSYHHAAEGALEAARALNGLAVLLRPARTRDVLALAAQGVRMPRKSTSFGPKPRTGLIMRTFVTE
jgi:uncharacterized protein (DUF1015 family)